MNEVEKEGYLRVGEVYRHLTFRALWALAKD